MDSVRIESACVRVCVCVRACVRACMRVRISRSSIGIDFGHVISANLYLAGFEDACRLPADLCRGRLGVLFVVAIQQRQWM